MTKDYAIRSSFEAETHRLFGEWKEDKDAWTAERQAVANVFLALWSSAITRERVVVVASALSGWSRWDEERLKPALAYFVRRKILRSRLERGTRLYEVNY